MVAVGDKDGEEDGETELVGSDVGDRLVGE